MSKTGEKTGLSSRVAAVSAIREIEALVSRRAFAPAEERCRALVEANPDVAEGWLWLARICLARNDLAGAREAVSRGLGRMSQDRSLRLMGAELSVQAGAIGEGVAALRALESDAQSDGYLLQRVAQLFTRLNLHREAERCYRRAVIVVPDDPRYLYNLATSAIALGRLEEAESLLDTVIVRAPDDYDAYYNRATLRRQTQTRNHVREIEARLAAPLANPMGEVQLAYGLAKELEDLGEYARAFAALKRGADARKRLLSYDVADDERAMAEIASTFDAQFFSRDTRGREDARPIFILGLPRSGTTLVDRILSSHSQVESLGEVSDFATALMRAVPSARNKFDLIRRSAGIDFAALGDTYCRSTAAVGSGAARRIDKTPINFLYLGLIARAMPNATIIHVRRGAMDVCYAMYKTLFRMAYPFSYDQGDLARYFIAYRRLMAHWRAMLPGRFLDVDYEELVANQEIVTRRLVAHCRLDWEEACLAFERNDRPSLTASSAQIRQKMYGTSVGLWRHYEDALAPLANALAESGVDIACE